MNNTELIDVTDQIKAETYFNEHESIEIHQMCTDLMDDFMRDHPRLITEPDFDDIFDDNIQEMMLAHFEADISCSEEAEEEMEEIIEHAKEHFFSGHIPPRSYESSIILEEPNRIRISEKLNILRSKPQPTQRTKEWYELRRNLITASNAYKAFENQSTQNQLIYEKCQPLSQSVENETDTDVKEIIMVNTNTTLHWGQKYEPLSVLYYEHTYHTKIEDFGCIQHEKYSFIGASPDGINIDPSSPRYGRMLEIKNIVNREMDGIPKKEYWIQMQLQMEVCDLNECDFLETKFVEYANYTEYIADTSDDLYEDEDGNEFTNECVSKDGKMKGAIIYFHTCEGKPLYVYRPLDMDVPSDIKEWHENILDKYNTLTFMKTIYWKLENVSCVLVCRNRLWFNDNVSELETLWKTVEKERVSGYEHRAPNRKQKKEPAPTTNTQSEGKCLLQFNKDSGKITVIKQESSVPQLGNITLSI